MSTEQFKGDQGKDFNFAADTRDKEKKFELGITPEDIENIKEAMEEEGKRPSQSFAFEGARLNKLKEISPETTSIIGNIEVGDEAWNNSKERFIQDTKFTRQEMAEFKDETGKNRYEHMLKWSDEKIKSDQVWAKEFFASDMKNLDPERFEKDNELQISQQDWEKMVSDLEKLLSNGKYNEVIERAGRMNDLKPQKFENEVASLFTEKQREGILENINKSQEGKDREYGEFARKVKFVSEFLPDLLGEIEISEDYWNGMIGYLDGKKEEAEKNGKEYRNVVDTMLNIKTIEKLNKEGKIEIK